ncbi:hypothetical protein BDW71DRAFT_11584 [Aspergillus fruticulosus]
MRTNSQLITFVVISACNVGSLACRHARRLPCRVTIETVYLARRKTYRFVKSQTQSPVIYNSACADVISVRENQRIHARGSRPVQLEVLSNCLLPLEAGWTRP